MLMRPSASRHLLTATACAAALISLVAVPASGAAAAASADSPAGFWYGTDSATVTVSGSAPYQEPVIGGTYGGYMGMIGDWAKSAGCGNEIRGRCRPGRLLVHGRPGRGPALQRDHHRGLRLG